MPPVEGWTPPDPNVFVPMEPITDAIVLGAMPEHLQFQKGESPRPRYFFSRAQVGGLLRKKSALYTKKDVEGKDTHTLFVTLDVGPVYSRTRDARLKKIRNVITCVFFDYQSRKLDRAIKDITNHLFSQPWITVHGTIENRFEWIDKDNLRLGKKPTGEMHIKGEEWFIPPVPKLSQVRPKYREEGFPDAPNIVV